MKTTELDRRRRFHWHQYFVALRYHDRKLARYHRRIAQQLQDNFRRALIGKKLVRLNGRPGRGTPAAKRGGKTSPKTARAESVAVARADHPKRKLRSLDDRAPGRAESERRSGTATLGTANGVATRERACRRCGCTQYNACEDLRLMDYCSWVEPDLCSACLNAAEFKRFLGGNRKPSLAR